MSDIISELRAKEQQIQVLRTRESRRQGQEDTLRKQLKEEFQLDTIEAANQELNRIGEQLTQTEKELVGLNSEMEGIIQTAISPRAGGSSG